MKNQNFIKKLRAVYHRIRVQKLFESIVTGIFYAEILFILLFCTYFLIGQKSESWIFMVLAVTIGLFSGLTPNQCRGVWQIVVRCILDLHMQNHFGLIERYLDQKPDAEEKGSRRILFLTILLKAARFGILTRQSDISQSLILSLAEDFYKDGDLDRVPSMVYLHGIATRPNLDKMRSLFGFMRSVCLGIFEAIAAYYPGFQIAVDKLNWNLRRWNRDWGYERRMSSCP
jgi:hypothetical protein